MGARGTHAVLNVQFWLPRNPFLGTSCHRAGHLVVRCGGSGAGGTVPAVGTSAKPDWFFGHSISLLHHFLLRSYSLSALSWGRDTDEPRGLRRTPFSWNFPLPRKARGRLRAAVRLCADKTCHTDEFGDVLAVTTQRVGKQPRMGNPLALSLQDFAQDTVTFRGWQKTPKLLQELEASPALPATVIAAVALAAISVAGGAASRRSGTSPVAKCCSASDF